jgi:protease-4
MRFLKAKLSLFIVGLLIINSGPASQSFGRINSNDMTSDPNQTETVITPSLVAHFHLSGVLTETTATDTLSLSTAQVTSLRSLVRLMEQASEDDELKAVILTFDGMSIEFGQLEEIRDSINRLKATGKIIYVHAEEMDTGDYALLCAGNYLSITPQSTLWLTGLYGESLFVKDLLDKIGIEADFMHVGDYKSGAEMLTNTEPSEAAEENLNWLLDGLYGSLVDMISKSRQLTVEQVKEIIDDGPYLANEALEKGLIDAVQTRQEFISSILSDLDGTIIVDNKYGRKKQPQINLTSPLALFSILGEMLNPPQEPRKETVALIYVDGTIIPGHGQASLLGLVGAAFSGDIRKALEIAAEDEYVKAVVMRVNSPGGSAEASEVILNATRMVKGKKPMIVSMGNVAASGGYYVSCGADTIFADEVTQTASIGVVGGKLATTQLWEKIGVNWVGYKRGENADLLNSIRPFDESQREFLNDYMEQVYDVFKGHVSEGRQGKLTKPIDEIAGGRVYTGKQALELGLVDKIGGLKQAIDYAAVQASLDDYEVRVIPEPKDFITMLLEELSGEGDRMTDIKISDVTNLFAGHPTLQPLLEVLQKLEPHKAKVLYRALQRVELLRSENVITMMPYDIVFN